MEGRGGGGELGGGGIGGGGGGEEGGGGGVLFGGGGGGEIGGSGGNGGCIIFIWLFVCLKVLIILFKVLGIGFKGEFSCFGRLFICFVGWFRCFKGCDIDNVFKVGVIGDCNSGGLFWFLFLFNFVGFLYWSGVFKGDVKIDLGIGVEVIGEIGFNGDDEIFFIGFDYELFDGIFLRWVWEGCFNIGSGVNVVFWGGRGGWMRLVFEDDCCFIGFCLSILWLLFWDIIELFLVIIIGLIFIVVLFEFWKFVLELCWGVVMFILLEELFLYLIEFLNCLSFWCWFLYREYIYGELNFKRFNKYMFVIWLNFGNEKVYIY